MPSRMSDDDPNDPPGIHQELERLRRRVAELERAAAQHSHVEAELRRVNASLYALLENTDDYVLFSDRAGNPVFFNSAYAAVMKSLLGIEMRPGLKPHELLPDEEARAAWDGYHARVLAGEKFTVAYEHRLEDGAVRYYEVRYNPVRQEDGEIVGFSEFTSDVTRYKLAEQALQKSNLELQARYRALAEHTSDIVSILDRDWRFTYTAPSVRAYGFEPSDIVGGHASDFAHPDDYPAVADALTRATERPGDQIEIDAFRVRDAEGNYSMLEGRFTCLFDVPGIDGIVFNGRDITERLRLQERLRHVEKMDAIGQLAGGIAHDFNNQLTGILVNADLLQRGLGDTPLAKLAEQIIHAAQRSADLTQKLLAFARKGQLRRAPIDVNQQMRELAELLERSFDKGIAIDVSLEPSPCVTVGDASMIHSAILNLALNARDAMPHGGHLRLRTERVVVGGGAQGAVEHELAPGSYVKVVVSDDGIGMDDATRRRMFEPFFTTKGPNKGTGMGLPSVYGTMDSHGGAVNVDSAPGEGTTVALYFPAAAGATVPDERSDADAPPDPLRILVVDDEPLMRKALALVLESLGHRVHTCADGSEAVELVRGAPGEFDLVVLDMIMPHMDGRQTLRALRELDPGVRALMVSGYSEDDTAEGLLEDGARGFLQKPFDVDAIAHAIQLARRDPPEPG